MRLKERGARIRKRERAGREKWRPGLASSRSYLEPLASVRKAVERILRTELYGIESSLPTLG